MFCTLEDAWGEKQFNEKPIFQQSDKPESFKSIEHFSNTKTYEDENENINDNINENIKYPSKDKLYNQYIQLKEMFGNDNHNDYHNRNDYHNNSNSHMQKNNYDVCIALDNHLAKCPRCRSKYLNYYNQEKLNDNYGLNFDLSSFSLNLKSNKDIITIFLFGLLIILLLQLFSSK